MWRLEITGVSWGKFYLRIILFLYCNFFSFSTMVGKFTIVISFIFFSLTVNPATANPLNASKTTPVPATTTPPPFGTDKLQKKLERCSFFHALTLYRSPMSIRLMFIYECTVVVVSQSQYDCDFETNYCSWKQDMSDVFNWTRAQGPTGSINTGPTNDHTKQNRKLRLCLT